MDSVSPLKTQYQVHIIKEGFKKEVDQGYIARGACSLIKGPHNILVGTGSPHEKQLLIDALEELRVNADDIEYVVCTQGHPEEVGNLNLFPRATHIIGYVIEKEGCYVAHDFAEDIPYEIDEFVSVLASPGHVQSAVSVLVRNSNLSTVAITGGTFMCGEDLEDPDLWIERSLDPDTQQQSRINLLSEVSTIIPCYGPMFAVPESYKREMTVVMTP